MSEENSNYGLVIQIDDKKLKTALQKLDTSGKAIEKSVSDGVLSKIESIKKKFSFDRNNASTSEGTESLYDRLKKKDRTALDKKLKELNEHLEKINKRADKAKAFISNEKTIFGTEDDKSKVDDEGKTLSSDPKVNAFIQRQQVEDEDSNEEPNEEANQSRLDKILNTIESIDHSTIGLLARVTTIAGAVTAIIGSSEYLQKMLELLQTAILLIFRPIGDFIGAFLKPILLYFYRYFIIPYVKQVLPIMHKLGDWLGNTAVKNWESNMEGYRAIYDFLADLFSGDEQKAFADDGTDQDDFAKKKKTWNDHLDNFFKWIGDGFSKFVSDLETAWDGFVTWLSPYLVKLRNYLGKAWDGFVKWITPHLNNIVKHLQNAWNSFTEWITPYLADIGGKLSRAWNEFTKWITTHLSDIGSKLGKAWNSFTSWLSTSLTNVGNNIGKSWNYIVDTFSKLSISARSTLVKIWNSLLDIFNKVSNSARTTLVKIWNNILTGLDSVAKSARTTLVTLWNGITKVFGSIYKNASTTLVTVWNGIMNTFNYVKEHAMKVLKPIWDNVMTVFSHINDSLKEGLVKSWQTIVGWFGALSDSAEKTLGPAWGKIVSYTMAIGKAMESGAKGFTTLLQGGLDILSKKLTSAFGNVIKVFNNFISSANNLATGVNNAKDNKDSDRPSSPDTGTNDKGPTDSKGEAGDAKGDKGDPSDTGGIPTPGTGGQSVYDNSKNGWYLYKQKRYLGVIQMRIYPQGQPSKALWQYTSIAGNIERTTTTAGYTARKNKLADGYDSAPPPDLKDPNNEETGGTAGSSTGGGNDGSGSSGGLVYDYSKKGYYAYKKNTYLGVVQYTVKGDNKLVYRDEAGRINTIPNTGITYSKTRLATKKADDKPSGGSPDTDDPNNEETKPTDDPADDKPKGGKKPPGLSDEVWEQVQNQKSSSIGSAPKNTQYLEKISATLEKIYREKPSKIEVKVTSQGDSGSSKIQEDVRRGGL